jgi:hypothetical protein
MTDETKVMGDHRRQAQGRVELGRVSAVEGRTIWIVEAHRDGKRFVVRADEKLTAFGSPLVARSSNLLISKEGVRITS